ncbi:lactonase family protein [Frateuria defendens]|uniref:lactonase family protein n=1 Tax=Frateuria defendens TaxID=2219559 RepID=UPI00069CEA3E|nr:lactonase family protein [Frateuria defendens]
MNKHSLKSLSLALALGMGLAGPAFAAKGQTHDLLVGTYTGTTSEGIYRYTFDEANGKLSGKKLAVATANPSWLVLNPAQTRVYAVSENGPGGKDIVGRVASYNVDAGGGALTLINRINTLGDEPTHVTMSPDERYLFVSNYAVKSVPGGMLAVVPIEADGHLQPIVQVFSHEGSKVNPERQLGAHVHSVTISPDGKYVFACDLGADKVYAYRYDPVANAERPLTEAQVPFTQLPPGSGPRHMVFSADGKHAYLTLEMVGKVAVLDYDQGKLTVQQILDLAEPGFSGKNGAGAIHLSPDGRFLYATNRGSDNQLVVYAVDPASGKLSLVQRRSVEGKEPREFAFDPDNRYVLIANQFSDQIVVIRRDPQTGKLGKTVDTTDLGTPSALVFLREQP